MKVFEFHFNPKLKEDLILDSFCYEPEKGYEKKLGNLYIVGSLKNALPQNKRLLKKLAEVIKEKHYSSRTGSAERALKNSLKEANKFLDKISKSGDISWLGNLDFFILSIKDSKLNFSKVGDIKPLLIRDGQITDIEEKVQLEGLEPYPLKIFANIVSGKLAENDLLCILTNELFKFFEQEKILKKITKLSSFNNDQLKGILNEKKQSLNESSGIFLTIHFIREKSLREKQTISQDDLKAFSFKKIFSPVLKVFEKLPKLSFKKPIASRKKSTGGKRLKSFRIPKIKFEVPKIKLELPKKNRALLKINKLNQKKGLPFHKNTILVSGLIIILILGFAFSKFEQKRKIDIYAQKLKEIQGILELSESFLILKDTSPEAFKKSNSLLEESWNKILPLSKNLSFLPKEFSNQVIELENEILSKLYELNKLENIESPELLFEFNRKEFVPNNLISQNNDLYFFSPYLANVFILKSDNQKKIIETEKGVNLATRLNDSILFFLEPDKLIVLKDDQVLKSQLEPAYQEPNFNSLVPFYNNLYFLDRTTGQIIKYGFLKNLNWDNPLSWLNKKPEKTIRAQSMTIDSSIWILKENLIYKYYKGEFNQEFKINIFPETKDLSKIYTSPNIPYLYILEPLQKRIIVLAKDGQVIKQLQSEKFDNLLDFSVSENGETIYLLNGLKVYKINL
ncbi:MAG: hypothetical protein KJI70_00070 [Patescibacteria group bacterium]|nr:hypothetical protein [Patescibacteria group bacterium]